MPKLHSERLKNGLSVLLFSKVPNVFSASYALDATDGNSIAFGFAEEHRHSLKRT